MAWVAVDMFGCERVYEQKPRRFANCAWVPTRCSYADRLNDFVTIPNGSIKKLIGRELSWKDEPVELKEE